MSNPIGVEAAYHPSPIATETVPSTSVEAIAVSAPHMMMGYIDAERHQPPEADPFSQLTVAYETFRPLVERSTLTPESDAFNGEGTVSRVYKLSLDGTAYAVRIPKDDGRHSPTSSTSYSPAEIVKDHLRGAHFGQRYPQLETIVAGSPEDGVVISEWLPGTSLDRLSLSEAREIPQTHMDMLVKTVFDASQAGVHFDAVPGNILYDREYGFSLIDYEQADNDLLDMTTDHDHICVQLLRFLDIAEANDYAAKPSISPDITAATHTLLQKLKTSIITAQLLDETKELAIAIIDDRIEELISATE